AYLLSFFFQAEDGIRDGHVTGVQTCALPISTDAEDGFQPGCSQRKYRVPPSTLAAGSNALGTPRLEAVFGISCINPRAPLGEMARGLKLLSALITLLMRSASRRFLPLAALTTWSRFRIGFVFAALADGAGAAALRTGAGARAGFVAVTGAG